jgi:leader peptidase (prepilin peptidase)/N-methyltransferase
VPLTQLTGLATWLLVSPALRAGIAVHSVAIGQPWRQACDSCGRPFDLRQPSAAFAPAGRCPTCHSRVGAPPYLVETALAAAIVLVAAIQPRAGLATVAVAWWAGSAITLAFVDASVHRLPDRLTYPAAAGTVALLCLATAVGTNDVATFSRSIVAGIATSGGFAALTLILGRNGPGLGDAKLLLSTATIMGWFGWGTVFAGLAIAFAGQGIFAVVLLATGRANRVTHLAMGPFLVAGAAVALILT